jgi:hypothetical protein
VVTNHNGLVSHSVADSHTLHTVAALLQAATVHCTQYGTGSASRFALQALQES